MRKLLIFFFQEDDMVGRDDADIDEMANGTRLAVGVDRWMCC